MADAWPAAASVAAAAYGVNIAAITAPSRGRGPRPPREVWGAKKMAVALTVSLCGRDYAAVARHLGLHRDTVHSHCASVRKQACDNPGDGRLFDALEASAVMRLTLAGAFKVPAAPEAACDHYASPRDRLLALQRHMANVFERALSDDARGSTDTSDKKRKPPELSARVA